MTQAETRSFKMHPDLLFSVIERQAGTLTKALLEGVMNSVDAGATHIEITIAQDRVWIMDDGRGFGSRQEVEEWFETFGQPHDDQREHKTYGNFRMGRGQMFAFGRNHWRTGTFSMDVDIKRKGLDYLLKTDAERQAGCVVEIELYEGLSLMAKAQIERDLGRWVRYVQVPVRVNERLVSKDPAKEKWSVVTDYAYIRLKESGSLSVYNLGVFVNDLGGYRFGVSGEVVSRQQLRVNFARNDVQSNCPVWKKIMPHLRTTADAETKKRKRLWTEDEKAFSAMQLAHEELRYAEAASYPLITDVTGSDWSLSSFANRLRDKFQSRVTSAPCGDLRGDRLMQQRVAFVVADRTLERFDCETVDELIELLRRTSAYGQRWSPYDQAVCVPFAELTKGISSDYMLLEASELTPSVSLLLEVLHKAQFRLPGNGRTRKLCVGHSEVADAWTDGLTYIALNSKNFRRGLDVGVEFWVEMAHLLSHEYCHHEASTGSHLHSAEFYQQYHDTAQGPFVACCMAVFPQMLKVRGRSMRKKTMRLADNEQLAACFRQEFEVTAKTIVRQSKKKAS